MIFSLLHLFVLVLLIQRCHKSQKMLAFFPQFPGPSILELLGRDVVVGIPENNNEDHEEQRADYWRVVPDRRSHGTYARFGGAFGGLACHRLRTAGKSNDQLA